MHKTNKLRRFISILVLFCFLLTPPVYPGENLHLRALSFAEGRFNSAADPGNPFRDLKLGAKRAAGDGVGKGALERRDLLVFTKPLDVSIEGPSGRMAQFPDWSVGKEIASGTVGLADFTRPGVLVEGDGQPGHDLVVDTWEEVMKHALGILHNYKEARGNKELLKKVVDEWRSRSEDRRLSFAILEGHGHVCDLASSNGRFKADGGEVTMRFDADTLRNIASMREGDKKKHAKEGLALAYSMAMVYFLHRQLGHDEMESYESMAGFYKALDSGDKARLRAFLKSPDIDANNTFINFLITASNLKGDKEQKANQLDRLAQMLRLQVLAGPPPFDLNAAAQVLRDENDFSAKTNEDLFNIMRDTYEPELARIYYERLSHIARAQGYSIISQRSSRVSQSQGAILSAAEVAVETDKLEACHRELMRHIDKAKGAIRKMKVGDERLVEDDELDGPGGLMSRFDFEKVLAEFELSKEEPVPVAVARRILALYEDARSELLTELNERLKTLRSKTAGARKAQRRLHKTGLDRDSHRCNKMIRKIREDTDDIFFAFEDTIDDAEKFQDILTVLVQRFSPKSAHTIARLLLGYRIYKETAEGMPEVRMRSMSNITIAPDVDVAIPNSSVYCENAALSIKLVEGMPVIDWGNMENIVITVAPYIYKAIQNAKKNGWPKFVYKMETTVGHGLIELIQALLEDEMTNIRAIEAHGLEGEVTARIESALNEIYAAGQEVLKRYALQTEVREIMETRGVTEREAALEVISSWSDVSRDVAYLLMIRKAGLEKRLRAAIDKELNKAARKMGRKALGLEYQQKLYTRACEEVFLQTSERKEQIGQIAENMWQERGKKLKKLKEKKASGAEIKAAQKALASARKDAKEVVRNKLASSTREFMTKELTYVESTARKEIIEAHQIDKGRHKVVDGQDYFFVYNPSRIHFGKTELPSVTTDAGSIVGGKPEAVEAVLPFIKRMNYSLAGPDIFPSASAAAYAKVIENSVRNVLHSMAAAVGMEAKASKIDARQVRQVIQERKTTHMLLWAAAMVGGYCLTKEPIFVTLVRAMTDIDTLDKLGIPREHHEHIRKIMRKVLGMRRQFPSSEEWEEEARRILGDDDLVRRYFGDTRLPNWLPDLRLIALVMDKLGDPVTEEGRYADMVAKYANQLFEIGLKINDLSAVVRVGDIYSGLTEARRLNMFATPDEEAKILMQCAYKENVSDVRETANMYMLLLLLGKRERIKHYGIEADREMTEIIDETIKGKRPPASISFSDPYVDIDGFMDGEIKTHAETLKAEVVALGLRPEQIEACVLKYGGLENWPVIQRRLNALEKQERRLSKARQTKAAVAKLGKVKAEIGKIEKAIKLSEELMAWLHMYVEGVEPDFLKASQGKDVVVINSGHANIRQDINEHLEWLYNAMSIGRPSSSHVFVDSTQQSYGPVLDWFGMLRWLNWGGVYRSADIAPEAIEGYRWEHTVRPRKKAEEFISAFFNGGYERAQGLLEARCKEVKETIGGTKETLRKKRLEAEEIGASNLYVYEVMAEGLIKLSQGVKLEELDFATFLVMGGMWMLDKQDEEDIKRFEKDYKDAMRKFGASKTKAARVFDRGKIDALIRPAHIFTEEEARLRLAAEIKGTTKEAPLPERTAAAGTAARIAKAAEQEAVSRRYKAFGEEYGAPSEAGGFEGAYSYAMGIIGCSRQEGLVAIDGAPLNELLKLGNTETQEAIFGRFLAAGLRAAEQLVNEVMPRDSRRKQALLEALRKFYNGKTIDTADYVALCGDHEDNPGLLNEMAMLVRDREPAQRLQGLKNIAQCGELLNIALLVGLTMRKSDTNAVLNSLNTYFDRLLNVHEYDYPPYGYHYLSGGAYGFESDYFRDPDKRREMMQLCYDHHQWILAYARGLVTQRTPLRKKSEDYIDAFLGNWEKRQTCLLYQHVDDSEQDIFWNNIRAVRDAVYLMTMDVQEGRAIQLPLIIDDVDPAGLGLGQDAVYAASNYTPGVHSTLPGISQGVRIHQNYKIAGSDGGTYKVRVGYTPRPITEKIKDDKERPLTLLRAPVSYIFLSKADCRRLGVEATAAIGPEGIPCILRFEQKRMPLVDAEMNHFTSQDHVNKVFEDAGVPVQWSNAAERMMYMKIVLPEIIKRAMKDKEAAGYLELIPQMNFLKKDLQGKFQAAQRIREPAKRKQKIRKIGMDIREQLIAFARKEETQREVVKPSEQSGGRGAAIYMVMDSKGIFITPELNKATDLVFRTCLAGDDVVVQAYVPNSPKAISGERFLKRVDEEFANFGIKFVRDEAFPPTATFFAGRAYPAQFDKDTRTIAGFNANIGVEEKVNLGMSARLFLGDPELCMEPQFAGLVRKAVEVSSFALLDAIEEYAPDFIKEYGEAFGLKDREDAAGISYGRMVSGLFDYVPYLVVKREDNPKGDEWVKVYFEPAPTRRRSDGTVENREGLRFYIYAEEGKKVKKVAIHWSQEEVIRRLRNGTMELKLSFFELNSGIGQVVQHQRALKAIGIDPSELVQHVWGSLGRRALAYREAVGKRHKKIALKGHQPEQERPKKDSARLQAEEEVADEKEKWFREAVEFAQTRAQEEGSGLSSDDISIVIMKYLESVLADRLALENSGQLQEEVAKSYQSLDDFQKLYETCVDILEDKENHRFPLQRRLQQDSRFIVREELPTGDIGERKSLMSRIGWSDDFISRLTLLTLENIRQGWRLPMVRVLDEERMGIADFERDIDERPNHVVVCGKLNLIESPLLKLAQDAERHDAAEHGEQTRNVLGVHWRWVQRDPYDNRLKVKRAIVYDRQRKILKEVDLPRPIEIDSAQILHLPIDDETKMHEEISMALELEGIPIINPYEASSIADDKYESGRRVAEAGLAVPETLLARKDAEKQIAQNLSDFIRKNWGRGERKALVVKPRIGTESESADSFRITLSPHGRIEGQKAGNFAQAVKHTYKLLEQGHDVLWQAEEGDVRYFDEAEAEKGYRRLVFNVQAMWNGTDWTADIGYAQVAEDAKEVIVSRGRGAGIQDIAISLQNLRYKNKEEKWAPLEVTAGHIQVIKAAVTKAAQSVNAGLPTEDMLKLVGVEIVLNITEKEDGQVEVIPVVIELNARPAGLAYSRDIIAPEQEDVIETQALFLTLDRAVRAPSDISMIGESAINNLFGSMADEGMSNEAQALIAKDLIAAHIHAIMYKGQRRITDKINKALGDTAHIQVIAAEVTDDDCIILDFRLKGVKRLEAGRPKAGPSRTYRSTYVADKASEIIRGKRDPLYKLQEEGEMPDRIGPSEIETIAGGNNLRVLTKIPGRERPTFFFDIGGVVLENVFEDITKDLESFSSHDATHIQDFILKESTAFLRLHAGAADLKALLDELKARGVLYDTLTYQQFEATWKARRALNDEAVGFITMLKSLGYKVCFISDANMVHSEGILEQFPDVFRDGVQDYVRSYEVGRLKQHGPGIYLAAFNRAAVNPENAVVVDDKPPYLDIAEERGAKTYHYTRERGIEGLMRFIPAEDRPRFIDAIRQAAEPQAAQAHNLEKAMKTTAKALETAERML